MSSFYLMSNHFDWQLMMSPVCHWFEYYCFITLAEMSFHSIVSDKWGVKMFSESEPVKLKSVLSCLKTERGNRKLLWHFPAAGSEAGLSFFSVGLMTTCFQNRLFSRAALNGLFSGRCFVWHQKTTVQCAMIVCNWSLILGVKILKFLLGRWSMMPSGSLSVLGKDKCQCEKVLQSWHLLCPSQHLCLCEPGTNENRNFDVTSCLIATTYF